MTILEEYSRWLSGTRGLNPNSIKTYVNKLKKIQAEFKKPIESFTIDEIEAYFSENKKRVNTKRLEQTVVKNFFLWYSEKYNTYNPAENLRIIKSELIAPSVITKAEFINLVNACGTKDFFSIQKAAMLCFLADTGVRLNEMINIKIGQIEETEENFIVLITGDYSTKTYVQRQIPFCDLKEKSLIAEYFSAYYQTVRYIYNRKADEYLFQPQRGGEKYSKVAIYQLIKTLAKKANITKKISPHSFRHFYATYCIVNNMKLSILQKRLGHKSLDTTMRYVHIADRLRKDALINNPLVGIKANKNVSGFVRNMKMIMRRKNDF